MAFEFKLPDIGEGVTEGEIVKWLVKEGQEVTEDQPIVEIMTDKATVEIPAPRTGKVGKLFAKVGDVVPVGKKLAEIIESGATAGKSAPAKESHAPARAPSAPAPQATMRASAPSPAGSVRVLASPATRKLARESGIDLSAVTGSGPLGRVTREDLTNSRGGATRAGAPMRPYIAPSRNFVQGGEERIPLAGIRRKIAEHMTLSKHKAAHFTHVDECDMTQIVDFRASSNEELAKQGIKLSYLSFVVKAICAALKEYPRLNATLDEEKNEIVIKHYFNIGLAVATQDNDLVVPVIKNADQKSLIEISEEIQNLAQKGRSGKLALDDLKGGTFTLTSTGHVGGLMATPIINYPEVGIVGFHKIAPRPVVRDGQIVIRQMANLSVSLDHRVVDGQLGATFLQGVIRYLENAWNFMIQS